MPADRCTRSHVFVVAAASLLAVARGAYPLTTDSNCNCYKTNATTSNYFSHHLFFDFRSLSQYVGVPKPIDSWDGNAQASPPSPFFTNPGFGSAWDIQNWNNTGTMALNNTNISDATVEMVNSPNNIYIERDSSNSQATHLTMRTIRHSTFQSASEIESQSGGYQFLSVRMNARTQGASGAVTAMFTYRPPPTPLDFMRVQEADLEIRTQDPPRYVQYTNQPSWNTTGDIPDATRNVTLPGGKQWSDWADYRMDWNPGSTTWYVNGQQVSHITFQAPRDPAQVIFNSWSDGGSWSGLMKVGDEAYLQVRWIEMVYNNTDPGAGKTGGCKNVCSIDETTKLGTPVLMNGGGRFTHDRLLLPLAGLLSDADGGCPLCRFVGLEPGQFWPFFLCVGQIWAVRWEELERVSQLRFWLELPLPKRLLLSVSMSKTARFPRSFPVWCLPASTFLRTDKCRGSNLSFLIRPSSKPPIHYVLSRSVCQNMPRLAQGLLQIPVLHVGGRSGQAPLFMSGQMFSWCAFRGNQRRGRAHVAR